MTVNALPQSSSNYLRDLADVAQGGEFSALTGKLYRFHGFRVQDVDDQLVGLVDWIWANSAKDQAEFIGTHLRWLRGRARAVPALGATVNLHTRTVYLSYSVRQINSARRFKIDRELDVHEKVGILAHFRTRPNALGSLAPADARAA
jgi:hypothetical protein